MAAPPSPTSLLIVEDDPQLRGALVGELAARGFEVRAAATVDEALTAIAGAPVDVVLTDLRRGGLDGLGLLRRLPEAAPRARAIVMSADASARDHQIAGELGAVAVLVEPFTAAELLRAIERAVDCQTGFQGQVHGLSLIDMAQMFHLAQRSICVRVHQPGAPPSTIHFERGEIVHAEHRGQHGPAALRALLATPSGVVATAPLAAHVQRTISGSFEQLLLASLSQIDEELQQTLRSHSSYSIPELGGIADLHGPEPDARPPSARVDDDEPAPAPDVAFIPELTRDRILAASQAARRDVPRPAPPPQPQLPALSEACRARVAAIDAAVASAVVSLTDGALLGFHQRPGPGEPLGEVLAAAAHALLGGPAIVGLAALDPARPHEAQLSTARHHLFVRALADGRSAVALVTRRTITVGMGWALLRADLARAEARPD